MLHELTMTMLYADRAGALLAPALAGVLLGLAFYASLWWSVRRGLASGGPLRWFVAAPLLRAGVTLAGFYLVGAGDWRRVLACLAGFLLGRLLTRPVLRLCGARHAP
jgi:F1F0 ATPase subunit 2